MAVRQGLLAVLSDGPQHGYRIKTRFESITGGVWKLNIGQVYTTLDRLERDGMVKTKEASDSKLYSLTPAGKSELAKWWEPDATSETPPRDELVLKILSALSLGTDQALKVVAAHRTALTLLLQQRRAQMNASDKDMSLATRVVNDSLLMRAESDLRWLDTCESRLLAERAEQKESAR